MNDYEVIKSFGYDVDEEGYAYNPKGMRLAPRLNHKGYPTMVVKRKEYFVHRIVAQKYIPNPDNLPQINHKDGVKTNNAVQNLEWCTNSENQKHAWANGLNKGRHTAVQCVETGAIYNSVSEAARAMGVKPPCIFQVCAGVRKTVKGYHWKYV